MSNDNKNPEQLARDDIDRRLRDAGWVVQKAKSINLAAALGVAVREYQTDVGPADYALFVDGRAVGIVEAKPADWGHRITTVEDQSGGYAAATLKYVDNAEPLPFVYESTGLITRFTNGLDPKPRSREVFSFARPDTLQSWVQADRSLRAGLQCLPTLDSRNLRECQTNAITQLEVSLQADRPRALIQMATGAGKTFTAITEVYRLLKFAGVTRVLFLVDTRNLGEQAEQEFMAYVPNDDNRTFTELYNVQRLKSSHIAGDSHVCISTIQRMYAILKGEELADGAEHEHPAERSSRRREPLPVVYSERLPPEFFDVVIIDEAHRSIYNLWRQVVEYFDAYLIGLTATPDDRTYGFFQTNVVSEYTHEEAVADGVNVGNEIYLIETRLTAQGGKLRARQLVERREKLTRQKRWERQDEDEVYTGRQLDRSVVAPDQIRTVIRTFRDQLPQMFPGRNGEVPKTLIFAKTDSHADDIIQIVRTEFGEQNAFCRKVTYGSKEDPKSILAAFRNDYHPRIAVTVDMIATGTDVKPLECLLFMRDVRSRNYFEQMKGRGTRVLDADDLAKVSPNAGAKTHYVIVDAVGVTKSLKTASQPLDTKPAIAFKDLAMEVMMGAGRDEETVTSLAGRLSRLDRQLDDKQRKTVEEVAGRPLRDLIKALFDSVDPDAVLADAQSITHKDDLNEAALDEARGRRVSEVATMLTGELIETLDSVRRDREQTVDHDNLDELLGAGWAGDADENARQISTDFEAYLAEHRDRLEALSIYFSHPARRAEITYSMIHEVLEALKKDRPRLSPLHVWRAYAHLDEYRGENPTAELTVLVALIRRVAGLDATLTRHSDRVRKAFQDWILKRHAGDGAKFDETQMNWLRMVRDHLSTSFHIERDDLEMAPFDGQGGLGRMYQLFGDEMDSVMGEINEAVAA